MKRVVYCPENHDVKEAEDLSRQTRLQIQVGESKNISNLEFDRTKVQVIEIPQINELYSLPTVQQNFHQIIMYVNEFLVLKNNIELKIDEELVKPIFEEKHRVKYAYFCSYDGVKCGRFYFDNKIIREFDFVVSKKI
jgi:hypothetical protein